MKVERFIARRIVKGSPEGFSAVIVRIAVISVALGLAVMIVAVAIVTGFQNQVREKIAGFGSHIQIARYDANNSLEFVPVDKNQPFYPSIEKQKGIKHIQVFTAKAGIIKTSDQIQGVVMKGVGRDFDWSYFKKNMVEGRQFSASDTAVNDSVIISRSLADALKIKLYDPLRTYFIIDNQARGRRFVVSGIYNTGLTEFDIKYVLCDIRQIQKLNGWDSTQVSGFEVAIDDFSKLDQMGNIVYSQVGYDLNARTIRQLYPQLFDWLDLQDMNVIIIIVLMVIVAGMAMISTLLILILERTNMIGVLKALGAANAGVQRVFLYNAGYIVLKGMMFGNAAGLALCLIQQQFKMIRLPQDSYFMAYVPIHLSVVNVLLLNAGTLTICMIMLLLPSLIVARISPVKAIRFD